MTNPNLQFVVTDLGLAAAQRAANTGIRVNLATFALGSGYGYVATRGATELQGDILFTDRITSYSNTPDGSLILECTVGDQVGTFQFGELGIFTDEGILFASCAFPNLLTKISSLGTQVNSTYTFNAYLKLSQALAVFNVIAYNQPQCTYGRWEQVIPPLYMSFASTNFVVTELDKKGDVCSLTQKNQSGVMKWSIQSNYFCLPKRIEAITIAPNLTYIEITKEDWAACIPNMDNITATIAQAANFSFVIESVQSYYRAVSAISIVGNFVRLTVTTPWVANQISTGTGIKLWVNDSSLLKRSEEDWLEAEIEDLSDVVDTRTTALASNITALGSAVNARIDTVAARVETVNTTLNTKIDSNSSALVNNGQILIPGDIVMTGGSVPRAGLLECNGAAVSRTVYAALFAKIGVTYGFGDGVTTFSLPDFRGYFPRAWDNGRGIDPGRGFGTTQGDIFGSHFHYLQSLNTSRAAFDPNGLGFLFPGGNIQITDTQGGSETRPKNIAVLFCIKY